MSGLLTNMGLSKRGGYNSHMNGIFQEDYKDPITHSVVGIPLHHDKKSEVLIG